VIGATAPAPTRPRRRIDEAGHSPRLSLFHIHPQFHLDSTRKDPQRRGGSKTGPVAELGKGSVMDGTAQEKLQRWPPEAGAARRRRQR